jgi:hypothetical protein
MTSVRLVRLRHLFAAACLTTVLPYAAVLPFAGAAAAESVERLDVGDTVSLALRDQHDAAHPVTPEMQLLLFTHDMDGGGYVKEALADGGGARLEAARCVYVSDLSGMPGPIRSMMALPSIRRREYRVAVDEDGTATPSIPRAAGKATVIELHGGKVASVSFAASVAEVNAALQRAAAAGAPSTE